MNEFLNFDKKFEFWIIIFLINKLIVDFKKVS